MASGQRRRPTKKKRSKSDSPKENQNAARSDTEDDEKPMPRDRKIQLGLNIAKLPCYELDRVLDMIMAREPTLSISDPDKLDIDLEKLKPSTLREVESYVLECLRKLATSKLKQPAPISSFRHSVVDASGQVLHISPGSSGIHTSHGPTPDCCSGSCHSGSKPTVGKPKASKAYMDTAPEEQVRVAMENLRVPLLPAPMPPQTPAAAQPPGAARNRRRPHRPHQPCGRPGCYPVPPPAMASPSVPTPDSAPSAPNTDLQHCIPGSSKERRFRRGVVTPAKLPQPPSVPSATSGPLNHPGGPVKTTKPGCSQQRQ